MLRGYGRFRPVFERRSFGGIGVVVAAHSDGALIEAVKAGEPAAKTGLQKGDRILSIGPQSIGGLSIKRIVSRLRGPIGEHVEMLIRRDARSEPFTVHVVRERIVSQTIFSQIRDEIVHIAQHLSTRHRAGRRAINSRIVLGSQLRGLIIDVRETQAACSIRRSNSRIISKSGAILQPRRHPRVYNSLTPIPVSAIFRSQCCSMVHPLRREIVRHWTRARS